MVVCLYVHKYFYINTSLYVMQLSNIRKWLDEQAEIIVVQGCDILTREVTLTYSE
jgi:hypothetical protein